jgi:hypothetical protein
MAEQKFVFPFTIPAAGRGLAAPIVQSNEMFDTPSIPPSIFTLFNSPPGDTPPITAPESLTKSEILPTGSGAYEIIPFVTEDGSVSPTIQQQIAALSLDLKQAVKHYVIDTGADVSKISDPIEAFFAKYRAFNKDPHWYHDNYETFFEQRLPSFEQMLENAQKENPGINVNIMKHFGCLRPYVKTSGDLAKLKALLLD